MCTLAVQQWDYLTVQLGLNMTYLLLPWQLPTLRVGPGAVAGPAGGVQVPT